MNTFCLSRLRSFAVLIAWRSAASGNRDEVGTSIALDSNSMLNPSWFPMISSQASCRSGSQVSTAIYPSVFQILLLTVSLSCAQWQRGNVMINILIIS